MNDATDDPGAGGLALGDSERTPHYRVLARKYRPASFDDLIGQDAMVRTISNAFETGRIPQAWILTGVRGVGKTTTARILARALNYQLPDGSIPGPTVKMPVPGTEDQAIMESRHVDVLEMDAASHNGVDDIRQINDAVRYAPVSARFKVYILDEVHMLSAAAFNALLKTLEEPPPHAKFIFATTEIRKVPVTVLSRCQRFDLRRVEADRLVAHLEGIMAKEGITAEPEALALIARAAEGSVRDALSLLDQAIAHAAGAVRAEDVRQMLGLADRSRVIDLFDALMRGDIAAALKELRDQYDAGADPAVVLTDLAEFTHFVTRVKVVPAVADDRSLAEIERTRGRAFATALSMRVLARTWQMLFKGLPEVQSAAKPIAAAEMVLVRIAYAADLPTPDEVVRLLIASEDAPASRAPGNGDASGPGAGPAARLDAPRTVPVNAPVEAPRGSAPRAAAAPQRQEPRRQEPVARAADAAPDAAQITLGRFEDLIALAAERRDLPTKTALERDVRLVRFEPGRLEVALEPNASRSMVGDLGRKISQWTGQRWMVVVSSEQGQPTIKAQNDARRAELERGVQADPLVKAVLARFPGAQIVAVREGLQEIAAPSSPEGDVMPPEPPFEDDSSVFAEHIRPDDIGDDD
ncbi:MAG TPA: DNA polymerase III subunit gamma/tau [Xanthobacteraceae bacterium]|nr:DNA polymerase III subunit gamma/tau [Xanthobacteraceae bacterium]